MRRPLESTGLAVFLLLAAPGMARPLAPVDPMLQPPVTTSSATDVGEETAGKTGWNMLGLTETSLVVQCLRQPPQFPDASIKAEESGRTVLRFEVLDDGTLLDASVQISSGFERLDAAALQHFNRCRALGTQAPAEKLAAGKYSLPFRWVIE